MNNIQLRRILRNYNNNNIDELIIRVNNETGYKYSVAEIRKEIEEYYRQNAKTTLKKYPDTLIPSKEQIIALNSTTMSKRIFENIKSVKHILDQADLDLKKYQELTTRMPTFNRYEAVKISAEKGTTWKGNPYNYKQVENVQKGLDRFKENKMEYENSIENYNMSLERVTPVKTWIWSTLEKTRHEEMDGTEIGLFELFEVTNEVTGDVDNLRFPGDYELDVNRCSNICNCGCSYETNVGSAN
ncbi:MAG: hypothetical protein LBU40_04495 [Methanobrevibacter sp.]|nr:hypothetical protein [Methanobrevibacter sp.]